MQEKNHKPHKPPKTVLLLSRLLDWTKQHKLWHAESNESRLESHLFHNVMLGLLTTFFSAAHTHQVT